MTLLMVWTNKPDDATAINLASDSLLSADDGKGGIISWRYATKIHRLHPTEDYFAYCGGSFVALSAISSAIAAISNSDHLSKVDEEEAPTVDARVKAIHQHLTRTVPLIPREWGRTATLLLCGWDRRKERFTAWKIELTDAGVGEPLDVDLASKRVHCFGSGAASAATRLAALEKAAGITTKGIVKVLVDVIEDAGQPTVGGAPQMVMLTKEQAVPVGFWWKTDAAKDERHLFGPPIQFSSKMESVKWVTGDFEDRPFVPFKRIDT